MNKGRNMNDSIYDTESHEYRYGNHLRQLELNLFSDPDDFFEFPPENTEPSNSIPHVSRPYYPPKTLDSYVRVVTCGKGFSGKIPADVIEKYNKIKKSAADVIEKYNKLKNN
tara:strand:- start:385 stop:720 length:336 start_codon:yes stop_codon:yes gene_type:complete